MPQYLGPGPNTSNISTWCLISPLLSPAYLLWCAYITFCDVRADCPVQSACYVNIPHLLPSPAMVVVFHSCEWLCHLAISSCLDDSVVIIEHTTRTLVTDSDPAEGRAITLPVFTYMCTQFSIHQIFRILLDQYTIFVHVDRSGNRIPGL